MRRKYNYPTPIEIEQLIKVLRSTKCKVERRKTLRELCLRLSFIPQQLTRKYKWAPNFSDLVAIGHASLLKAILSFDPGQCNNYKLWTYRWIRKSVAVEALREKEWLDFQGESEQFEEMAEDLYAEIDIETDFLKNEDQEVVRFLISKLDKPHRDLINLRFGLADKEKSVREVAAELNLSTKKVCKVEQEAIGSLKKLYNEYSAFSC